jgi:ABC-type oligopeptide transport system ATPase subunit
VAFEVKGKIYVEKPNIMQNLTKNKERKIQQNATTIQKSPAS